MKKKVVDFDELEELPDSWDWIPLEKLMVEPKRDIVDGPFGSNLKASEYTDKGVHIARLQNIDRDEFIFKNIKFISPEKAEQLDRHSFQPGDVLITKLGAPLGKACIAPKKIKHGIIVADLVRVRIRNDNITSGYLTYAINAPFLVKQFEKHTKGTTRPRVNLDVIRKLPIPVAPKKEQKRIVSEIEKQFSRLDEAVENLKRVKSNLKKYKASVLKAAVEGKLTEEWRKANPDVEPADKLLERILVERRKKWEEAELPTKWLWTNLAQIKKFSLYGPRFSSKDYSDTGYYVLRTSDINDIGKLNIKDTPKLPLEKNLFAKYRIKKGDLLITRTGSIGTLAVYNDNFEAIPGAYLIHYRLLIPHKITAWFIFYFLKSPFGQGHLTKGGAGVGRKNLNAPTIEKIPIPLPPLEEQTEIVDKIEAFMNNINMISLEIDKKLAWTQTLRQSILQKAFSGQLVSSTNEYANNIPDEMLMAAERSASYGVDNNK